MQKRNSSLTRSSYKWCLVLQLFFLAESFQTSNTRKLRSWGLIRPLFGSRDWSTTQSDIPCQAGWLPPSASVDGWSDTIKIWTCQQSVWGSSVHSKWHLEQSITNCHYPLSLPANPTPGKSTWAQEPWRYLMWGVCSASPRMQGTLLCPQQNTNRK